MGRPLRPLRVGARSEATEKTKAKARKEDGGPGARESNPRASYGACQETHVLHYLERLFCTHVDALHESALANVVARCGLFQSLCAFLDERGASIPPEDRRAGLYALSGIIATGIVRVAQEAHRGRRGR